jgi:hypothetical protein
MDAIGFPARICQGSPATLALEWRARRPAARPMGIRRLHRPVIVAVSAALLAGAMRIARASGRAVK